MNAEAKNDVDGRVYPASQRNTKPRSSKPNVRLEDWWISNENVDPILNGLAYGHPNRPHVMEGELISTSALVRLDPASSMPRFAETLNTVYELGKRRVSRSTPFPKSPESSVKENLERTGKCTSPDVDAPKLFCGYPLPCPHHTILVFAGEEKEKGLPSLDVPKESGLDRSAQAIEEKLREHARRLNLPPEERIAAEVRSLTESLNVKLVDAALRGLRVAASVVYLEQPGALPIAHVEVSWIAREL